MYQSASPHFNARVGCCLRTSHLPILSLLAGSLWVVHVPSTANSVPTTFERRKPPFRRSGFYSPLKLCPDITNSGTTGILPVAAAAKSSSFIPRHSIHHKAAIHLHANRRPAHAHIVIQDLNILVGIMAPGPILNPPTRLQTPETPRRMNQTNYADGSMQRSIHSNQPGQTILSVNCWISLT